MGVMKLFKKYADVIPYLFFGVCTTIVNVIVYWIGAHLLSLNTLVSTITAWVCAVLFAYVTNRKWVFHSEVFTGREIAKEVISFFSCRLVTGIIDWVCMFIFVELLGANDVIIKFAANVLVIVLNYIASRLVIFRRENVNEKYNRKI